MGKHAGSASTPRSASRAPQPRRGSLGLDEITLKFSSQKDYGAKDPLDWLFAQTQLQSRGEDLHRTENTPAALWLFWGANIKHYEGSHELDFFNLLSERVFVPMCECLHWVMFFSIIIVL